MGHVLGAHQRISLIGEADADELGEHLVETIDCELARRRRRDMILSPTTVVETLLYVLKRDQKLARFIATDALVAELHELVTQRVHATRKVAKRARAHAPQP